jgi:hypothetical protein
VKSERWPTDEEQQSLPATTQRNKEEREDHDLCRKSIAFYRMESDEQIYQHLRCLAAELGRPPTKAEVPGFYYIKSRLGNWPRILEKAGLKPVSARHKKEINANSEPS